MIIHNRWFWQISTTFGVNYHFCFLENLAVLPQCHWRYSPYHKSCWPCRQQLSHSVSPPSFQVSRFWTLENTVLLMYSFLCFIFWFSMFLSVLLSAVSVLYVFLSFLFLFNLFLSLLSVLFCSLSRSTFYSFLLVFPLPLLFSSFSVYSLIFWSLLLFSFKICYPFYSLFLLLYSVCLFVMFLCSTCSLSVIIHLFRALYLIFFRYLFRSCFYFLYNSSFW